LIRSKVSNAGLLSVVSHEHRDKQCQHKYGTEQIENDEEDGIPLRGEFPRLSEDTSNALA
jgi:hypothetical protein